MTMGVVIEFQSLRQATVQVEAIAFLPDINQELRHALAIFAPGYTDDKTPLLSWGFNLAAIGIATMVFDLPGHYLGSLYPLRSLEDFFRDTPLLFVEGFNSLAKRLVKRARFADSDVLKRSFTVVLGGHSLGARLAMEAAVLKCWSERSKILIGVAIGVGDQGSPHVLESEHFQGALEVRRQLVSPHLAPEKLTPRLKMMDQNFRLRNATVFLLTGQDDVFATPSRVQRLESILRANGNHVTTHIVRRLPHHDPKNAAPQIANYLTHALVSPTP
jgi:hypothetical protein